MYDRPYLPAWSQAGPSTSARVLKSTSPIHSVDSQPSACLYGAFAHFSPCGLTGSDK